MLSELSQKCRLLCHTLSSHTCLDLKSALSAINFEGHNMILGTDSEHFYFSFSIRERRTRTRSQALSTLGSMVASPCSTTLTMASCYIHSISNHWWPSNSTTSPLMKICVLSAKYLEPTLTTARKTAIRDVLNLNSISSHLHDLSYENSTALCPFHILN